MLRRVLLALCVLTVASWAAPAGAQEAPSTTAVEVPTSAPTTDTTDPSATFTKALGPFLPILVVVGALGLIAPAAAGQVRKRRSARSKRTRSYGKAARPKSVRRYAAPVPVTVTPLPRPPTVATDPYLRAAGTSAGIRAALLEAESASLAARAAECATEAAFWRKGELGEQLVARALEALHGATWRVLHDLVIGSRGANVDHLVIGPSGVFTINTKNVSGPVWVAERALLVAGTKHSEFLPKAVNEAANVSTMLSRAVGAHVDVTPAIVFVDCELTVKAMPTDVAVLGIEQLARWLKSRPTVFTSEQVNALGSAAAQPQTWMAGARGNR